MDDLNRDAKIAITGGAGYIGSFTVRYLLDQGFKNIVILDNFSTGHKKNAFSRFSEVDLLDNNKLNEIFDKEQFEGVIHFASLALVPESMADPYRYFNHNFNTSLNLLEAMKRSGTKKIVFSSSCSVYGTPKKLPINEDSPLLPESVYAQTKKMIEELIGWYSQIYAVSYVNLRYFNACGAAVDGSLGELHRPETHLIPCAIIKILKGETIEIYGNDYDTSDKTCIRDYIHVQDLASAHLLALKYLAAGGQSDVFNLGVGRGNSNLEVVQAILKVAEKNGIKGEYIFKPRRAGDPPALYADNSKAKKILDWSPKYINIEEIVEAAFNFHKKNFNV